MLASFGVELEDEMLVLLLVLVLVLLLVLLLVSVFLAPGVLEGNVSTERDPKLERARSLPVGSVIDFTLTAALLVVDVTSLVSTFESGCTFVLIPD